jgi:hypothetical protein
MSVGNIARDIGAGAGLLSLGWYITQVALERRVAMRVTARPEWSSEDGLRVEITNRSRKRQAQVGDVEVLHSPGLFRRRVAVAAGPGLRPHTPWTIDPDQRYVGWLPLRAVDGSAMSSRSATQDFSRPIKVRVVLVVGRGPTSRRFKAKAAGGS